MTTQGLVGGGMFLQRPDQRYLHVHADVVYTITIESANQRGANLHERIETF